VAYLEEKVDNLNSENNQLRNELLSNTELQQKYSDLEEQKNFLIAQFENQVQNNVSHERRIEELHNEVSRLQKFEEKYQDLETLKREKEAAYQLLQAKLDEVIALQKQNQKLSEALQSVQEKIENNEKLEQRCRELENMNAELSNKLYRICRPQGDLS
jgi:DNA repair exonuclease SbcCD ATPase subunit